MPLKSPSTTKRTEPHKHAPETVLPFLFDPGIPLSEKLLAVDEHNTFATGELL